MCYINHPKRHPSIIQATKNVIYQKTGHQYPRQYSNQGNAKEVFH